MDNKIIGLLIAEGSKVIGEFIRNRNRKGATSGVARVMAADSDVLKFTPEPFPGTKPKTKTLKAKPREEEEEDEVKLTIIDVPEETEGDSGDVPDLECPSCKLAQEMDLVEAPLEAKGCTTCSMDHFSACAGLMDEAVRFARKDGLRSDIALDRIAACRDQLNAMERRDLTPQQLENLDGWEKEVAHQALNTSRDFRHRMASRIKTVDDLEKLAADMARQSAYVSREVLKHNLGDDSETVAAVDTALERYDNLEEDKKREIVRRHLARHGRG